MTLPDRSIFRPSMVAGSRIAVGRGARYTHRELVRLLGPVAGLGYALTLALAMAQPRHAQRAISVANAIVLAGVLYDGAPIFEIKTW
jgi:hypothetical protein